MSLAPLLGPFSASRHGFWTPEAGAFAKGSWGVTTISATSWRGRLAADEQHSHTTDAQTWPLSEACK